MKSIGTTLSPWIQPRYFSVEGKTKTKKVECQVAELWTWGTITTSYTLILTGKNHHSQL